MSMVEKFLAGTLAVVALGLLLTKPAGTTALGNAIGTTYATGVKSFAAF